MKNQQTKDQLRITLLANAGIVLEYNGCTLLLDGIYQDDQHDLSNFPSRMCVGLRFCITTICLLLTRNPRPLFSRS